MKKVTRACVDDLLAKSEILLERLHHGNINIHTLYSETKNLLIKAEEAGLINLSLMEEKGCWIGDEARYNPRKGELVVFRDDWDHKASKLAKRGKRSEYERAYDDESCIHQFDSAVRHVKKQCGRLQVGGSLPRPYGQKRWQPAVMER